MHPILHGIVVSYERFFMRHTQWNENFKLAFVFENLALTLDLRTPDLADEYFFGELMENNAAAIRNLKVSDIFDNGYSSIENFTQNTGIPICQRKLTGLRGLYDTASIKYSKDPEAPIDNTPIHTFVNRFTRGSKTFRKVFREKKMETVSGNMVRFAYNTETIIGLNLSEILNESWNISYLDNSTRTFIFKLHNNALSYNHVITHFVDNIEPYCNFCLLTRHFAPERDTALHVFYTCPVTEAFNEHFFSWVMGTQTIPRRSEIFGVFQSENEDNNKILFLATKFLQKYLWDCKLRNTLPRIEDLREIVTEDFRIMKKANNKFRETLEACTINALK